jgi:hypothetical protein
MDVIKVEGGHPVSGEVRVEGAKNSALSHDHGSWRQHAHERAQHL